MQYIVIFMIVLCKYANGISDIFADFPRTMNSFVRGAKGTSTILNGKGHRILSDQKIRFWSLTATKALIFALGKYNYPLIKYYYGAPVSLWTWGHVHTKFWQPP
jgi:hypothetical protein